MLHDLSIPEAGGCDGCSYALLVTIDPVLAYHAVVDENRGSVQEVQQIYRLSVHPSSWPQSASAVARVQKPR